MSRAGGAPLRNGVQAARSVGVRAGATLPSAALSQLRLGGWDESLGKCRVPPCSRLTGGALVAHGVREGLLAAVQHCLQASLHLR